MKQIKQTALIHKRARQHKVTVMLFVPIFLFISFNVVTAAFQDLLTCEDYSPCSCQLFQPYGLIVHCGNPFDGQLLSVHQVQKVFNRTKAQHVYWLDLLLSPETESDIKIPANFLGEKSVDRLGVDCSTTGHRLRVHPGAFSSSIHQMGHFEVGGCDLIEFNLNFLAETTRLISLSISSSVHFQGFPPLLFLSRVISLRIYKTLDFQHWNQISILFPYLESLFLDGTLLGDLVVNKILNSIASSSKGNNTLQQLSLWENQLTVIPDISSFQKLSYVNLFGNSIISVSRGSLSFHMGIKVTFLILTRNALETIESGAFHGDFSEASVYLDFNHLTRFDSAVYENLLEQMYRSKSSSAGLYVRNNPFDCNDCHLNWLIRDKGHLLGRVHGGRCSNGTWFEDLSPEGYQHCS